MRNSLWLALALLPMVGCSNIFKGEGTEDDPLLIDDDGDGYTEADGDCDDTDASVSPGESEKPYDGIDNDCNASTTDDDLDGDGYAPEAGDCDDGDASVNPGASEIPYNGEDDDCSSATKDDDLDGDGYAHATDCDDTNAAVHPGATEVPYDGKDNDCSPATPDDDLDGDGVGHSTDCNDDLATVYPGAPENFVDGVDNDCDGQIDERFDLETVDEASDRGLSNTIAVDSAGAVFVAYYDYEDGNLYFAKRDATRWSTPTAVLSHAGVDTGDWLDSAVDGADQFLVGYTSYSYADSAMELDLIYRTPSGSWSEEYVVDEGSYEYYSELGMVNSDDVGANVQMALDGDDLPSFAYRDGVNGMPILADLSSYDVVLYAPFDVPVLADPGTGYFTSLDIDSTGYDHVAFYDAEDYSLAGYGYPDAVQYTKLDTNYDDLVWGETVNGAGGPGYYASLALNGATPCVAWMEAASADLKYACRAGTKNWTVETVESTGAAGAFAHLEFNTKGIPYIAYFNQSTGKLRVAVKGSGSWNAFDVATATTVDNSSYRWTQQAIDMVIDHEDMVHISYYDATTKSLYYARGK
ncbi:MAG: putative metal-binding motif-containing protein [Deltaproteobacteria bacterium]|nr:putative metal-binding motif-containing protein [Deltaproteobacteria bacterium]